MVRELYKQRQDCSQLARSVLLSRSLSRPPHKYHTHTCLTLEGLPSRIQSVPSGALTGVTFLENVLFPRQCRVPVSKALDEPQRQQQGSERGVGVIHQTSQQHQESEHRDFFVALSTCPEDAPHSRRVLETRSAGKCCRERDS